MSFRLGQRFSLNNLGIIFACYAALAGCASTVEVPKEVRVPVPVPCIRPEQLPERPQFMTDADILAFDSYRRTWALWLDRALRQAYEAQLEAVAKGCSTIPSLKVKS